MPRPRLSPPLLVAAVLFTLGALVRAWFVAEYRPAFLGYIDAVAYVRAAAGTEPGGLFSDFLHPAGYALFLRVLHAVNANLTFTIAVQHALGLATAALLYLAVARVSRSPWIPLLPAAVVLFDGLQIWYEHAVLTETLATAGVAAALYAALRAADGRWWWLVAAGVLAASSGLVRNVGLALVPLFALWLLWVLPGGARRRAAGAAIALASGLAVVGVYAAAQSAAVGSTAISREQGRVLYARVAPFADCGAFTPPAGTERLCERTPPSQRLGTNHYLWDATSPAWQVFGVPPAGDDRLAAFGRAAIRARPGDYVSAVARDLRSFFRPGAPQRFISHADVQPYAGMAGAELVAYYETTPGTTRPDLGPLRTYAAHVIFDGYWTLAFWILGAAGALLGRGRERRAAVLLWCAGAAVVTGSVAFANYDARYALPGLGPMAAAAALGLSAALARLAEARNDETPRSAGLQ